MNVSKRRVSHDGGNDNLQQPPPAKRQKRLGSGGDDATVATTTTCYLNDDVLSIVLSFLPIQSLYSTSLVNRQWYAMSGGNAVWQPIYEQSMHMQKLIAEIDLDLYGEHSMDGLFTEQATWKPSLLMEEPEFEVFDRARSDGDDGDDDDDDLIDHESLGVDLRREVNLKEVLTQFGSPLQRGTISDQYELVKEHFTIDEYSDAVKKYLGIMREITEKKQEEEQVLGHLRDIDSNFFMQKCRLEYEQWIVYRENQRNRHIDDGSTILIATNNDLRIAYFEEGFNRTLKEEWLVPVCVNTGIQRMVRQAGVVYYEPLVITLAESLLRQLISRLIQEAAKRLDDLNVVYEPEKYTGFFEWLDGDPSDEEDGYDEEDEDLPVGDDVNERFKIDDMDIVEAYRTLYGTTLYFGSWGQSDSSDDSSSDSSDDAVEDETAEDPDLLDHGPGKAGEGSEGYENNGADNEAEEGEAVEEEEGAVKEEAVEDDDFIDDSELECITDDNDLGDSLQDELLKVSMRVHEQVYGKERAHREKMYLKNWFGYGPSMFQHAPGPGGAPYVEDDFTYSGKSEAQIIEHDRQEDICYFGYSLYDDVEGDGFDDDDDDNNGDGGYDEDNEPRPPASAEVSHTNELPPTDETTKQVDGTAYHLRRLLRQESIRCIEEYFNRCS